MQYTPALAAVPRPFLSRTLTVQRHQKAGEEERSAVSWAQLEDTTCCAWNYVSKSCCVGAGGMKMQSKVLTEMTTHPSTLPAQRRNSFCLARLAFLLGNRNGLEPEYYNDNFWLLSLSIRVRTS
jgi:hypothetical protein